MKPVAKFDHKEIEKKWQRKWKEKKIYRADNSSAKKYYLLVELAYTSGDLHMGHWFAWTAPDILARFRRMQGQNILFPVGGFDAFGLPAENAAIKKGIHPRDWTYKNIEVMRKQFETMGPSFDWEKEVITSDPEYYRWTQWIFLKLYKAGLVYKAKMISNWCPECKTVLANEHVVNGCCWRHTETKVIQKEVPQWLVAITKYADKLIWPKVPSADWPQEAMEAQNKWIGKSEGTVIKFKIQNLKFKIEVFTTRLDTIFGATFLVLAPEHPLSLKLATPEHINEVKKYIDDASKKMEIQRLEEAKNKTGVFTGSYAVNPLSGQKIPIYIGDFVLLNYGTGAIMGVPAHDQRDWEFAKSYKLEVKEVVSPTGKSRGTLTSSQADYGVLLNSGIYSGIKSEDAIVRIAQELERRRQAEKKIFYHLRDWTISRQRYWGAPIPIIYCKDCGVQEVPEEDLPVVLPKEVDYTPTGKPPLASAKEWLKVDCPNCGKEAQRETETLDTYVDSSWYFLRYPDPKNSKEPFNKKLINAWMPIKIYFGGPEHILGHTLYARFITKVLKDLGYLEFDEFTKVRRHHGVILGSDGVRMSKSRGNVVNPDDEVKKYGADAVRLYLCFLGPHDKGGAWNREGIEGSHRFLQRVWNLVTQYLDLVLVEENDARDVLKAQHQTIQKVTKDIETLRFNTAVAKIMEFVNLLYEKKTINHQQLTNKHKFRCAEWDEALRVLVKLIAPFAPHMAEELWVEVLGEKFSVHKSAWPEFNPEFVQESEVTVVIQVNGKLRGEIQGQSEKLIVQSEVEKKARENENIKKWLKGKTINKTIFVPGKLINFVID